MLRLESINQTKGKIKGFIEYIEKRDIYAILILIIIAICSYLIGRLSILDSRRVPVTIDNLNTAHSQKKEILETYPPKSTQTSTIASSSSKGLYIGSKQGKKYHLPTCPGALQIADPNKIWFQTKDEAQNAGYTPALNCPGI